MLEFKQKIFKEKTKVIAETNEKRTDPTDFQFGSREYRKQTER